MNTAEATATYIDEHPHVKRCLQQGLINYSSLARHIAKALGIEKKTSLEAILIAARRYKADLAPDEEPAIRALLAHSSVETKTKIAVFIVEKNTQADLPVLLAIPGTESLTLIAQERHAAEIEKRCKGSILRAHRDQVLITLQSPKTIETTGGVIAFLTSRFAENGVNISEMLSCWTDTMMVIDPKDLNKAIGLLSF